VDFGLAKTMGEEITLTRTGMLIGSPAYMSPEQVRQQPLDERSDLFSLASVTYELLTGTFAFDGEDVTDVLMSVITDDPPLLSERLPSIDPDLDRAFHEAFQKDPDKRPQNVALWARKVTSLLEGAVSPATGWNPAVLLNAPLHTRGDS
jgi:serine/threonine-protein kinase